MKKIITDLEQKVYEIKSIIDNGASPRLAHILSTENHISDIQTIVDGETREHCLGFMQWDSLTQNFEYSNLGLIKSLSELSNHLADEFST